MSQPRTISYALVVPALVLDLFVIAIMGYAASGAVQDKVYTNGGGIIGPLIGLIVAGLETLYLTIALLLTAATVAVPALAAILVDSLLIPCYLAGVLALGLSINWDYLGHRVGTCGAHILSDGSAWRVFGVLQILGMGLKFLGLVLAVIDLARVIRIRRAARSTKKEVS